MMFMRGKNVKEYRRLSLQGRAPCTSPWDPFIFLESSFPHGQAPFPPCISFSQSWLRLVQLFHRTCIILSSSKITSSKVLKIIWLQQLGDEKGIYHVCKQEEAYKCCANEKRQFVGCFQPIMMWFRVLGNIALILQCYWWGRISAGGAGPKAVQQHQASTTQTK